MFDVRLYVYACILFFLIITLDEAAIAILADQAWNIDHFVYCHHRQYHSLIQNKDEEILVLISEYSPYRKDISSLPEI